MFKPIINDTTGQELTARDTTGQAGADGSAIIRRHSALVITNTQEPLLLNPNAFLTIAAHI